MPRVAELMLAYVGGCKQACTWFRVRDDSDTRSESSMVTLVGYRLNEPTGNSMHKLCCKSVNVYSVLKGLNSCLVVFPFANFHQACVEMCRLL